MDRTQVATDRMRDDEFAADKKKFDSFRLGGGRPLSSNSSISNTRSSHSRSHSRNNSISSAPSLSFSLSSNSTNDMSPFSFPSQSTGSTSSKRNSHHRRRSSVSTRRESAEVMGVSLPDLPPSKSEENINLGEKDSIRRRALWALEGKTDSGSFSPVEIPELNNAEVERRIFEFPSKPSYPPGVGSSFGSGLSGLASKRESFGKHLVSSSVSKDQLHTLIEEEEEEEEDLPATPRPSDPPVEVASPDEALASPSPLPGRHRPVGLTLRPLSLTPDNFVTAFNDQLPTPEYTPSPKSSGLRSLTLGSSPLNDAKPSPNAARRQSLILSSSTSSSGALFRRASLNLRDSISSTSSSETPETKRRSSICYKTSQGPMPVIPGLPTPDLTPTTDRHMSLGSESDWERTRSFPNEHQFFHQSHAALVARISDLERALSSSRTASRPVSYASDASALSEPSDELLQLIADLKAERDELKKDVDGWRVRVADLEKQRGLLAGRVDQERREAWVARERLGLLEIEKRAVAKDVEEKTAFAETMAEKYNAVQVELAAVQEERDSLQEQVKKGQEAEEECARLREALAEEKKRREDLERELEGAGLLNTPTPDAFDFKTAQQTASPFMRHRDLGMQSVDSESSFTDVESVDGFHQNGLDLKAVEEEDEQTFSDEDNGLAGYEDEEDCDISFESPGGSSIASLDDLPRSTSLLRLDIPTSKPLSVSASPTRSDSSPVHERSASLSKTWSFPVKGSLPAFPQRSPDEVDHFFGCLEDLNDSPPSSSTSTIRNPFSSAFSSSMDDDDELPPFVLPADVGVEVPTEPSFAESQAGLQSLTEEDEPEEQGLEVVMEEDEEFIGEEDEGGIKFTFTIPPQFHSPASTEFVRTPSPPHSPTKLVSFYEPFSEDDEEPFTLKARSDEVVAPKQCTQRAKSPAETSPSSIPRAAALKRFETPTKIPAPRFSPPTDASSFMTPPKRAVARPSFIPQPRRETNSPSASPKQQPIAPPTFLPQPQRKTSTPSTATRIKLQSPH
ncbi:hypothetical protein DENSPDRAFT_868183, partial [Dentipellis sp. KUC8613]